MKKILFLTVFAFFYQGLWAQPDPEEARVRKGIAAQVQKMANEFKSELTDLGYLSAAEIEFRLDTFRIERRTDLMMENPYFGSTMGMGIAMAERYNDYDALLNKYYKWLMAKLNKADQDQLRASQRAWLDFRDKNRALIMTLGEDRNSGGGTMQRLITSGRDTRILIERVSDIADYYLQMSQQ